MKENKSTPAPQPHLPVTIKAASSQKPAIRRECAILGVQIPQQLNMACHVSMCLLCVKFPYCKGNGASPFEKGNTVQSVYTMSKPTKGLWKGGYDLDGVKRCSLYPVLPKGHPHSTRAGLVGVWVTPLTTTKLWKQPSSPSTED